jgi:hypothetical protein
MLCGSRSTEDYGECQQCRKGPLLDIRKEEVRELIREHYSRLRQSREQWWLWVGVAIGIVVVLGAAIGIPMYRKARQAMALPFFSDQIILMALIAWGSQVLLSRLFKVEPPFPEVK